jgi:hypothetical protein
MGDYYAVLNVPENCTTQEVYQAFKALSKVMHPDKSPTADAYTFQLITQAKEVLMDPTQRWIYDQFGLPGLVELRRRFTGRGRNVALIKRETLAAEIARAVAQEYAFKDSLSQSENLDATVQCSVSGFPVLESGKPSSFAMQLETLAYDSAKTKVGVATVMHHAADSNTFTCGIEPSLVHEVNKKVAVNFTGRVATDPVSVEQVRLGVQVKPWKQWGVGAAFALNDVLFWRRDQPYERLGQLGTLTSSVSRTFPVEKDAEGKKIQEQVGLGRWKAGLGKRQLKASFRHDDKATRLTLSGEQKLVGLIPLLSQDATAVFRKCSIRTTIGATTKAKVTSALSCKWSYSAYSSLKLTLGQTMKLKHRPHRRSGPSVKAILAAPTVAVSAQTEFTPHTSLSTSLNVGAHGTVLNLTLNCEHFTCSVPIQLSAPVSVAVVNDVPLDNNNNNNNGPVTSTGVLQRLSFKNLLLSLIVPLSALALNAGRVWWLKTRRRSWLREQASEEGTAFLEQYHAAEAQGRALRSLARGIAGVEADHENGVVVVDAVYFVDPAPESSSAFPSTLEVTNAIQCLVADHRVRWEGAALYEIPGLCDLSQIDPTAEVVLKVTYRWHGAIHTESFMQDEPLAFPVPALHH